MAEPDTMPNPLRGTLPDTVKALTFDVGGTVLDWHTGISAALAETGAARGLTADWPAVTNAWRRQSLAAMLGERKGKLLKMNIDGVHRHVLDAVAKEFGLKALSKEERDGLALAWHRLAPWPDAPEGIARLGKKFTVSTLTILSRSLIEDVSRAAPFHWDMVFSCEEINVYKPRPEAYRTGAERLGLAPEQCMMVACHNFDLLAAQKVGFRTAFIRRPREWGHEDPPEPNPDPSIDLVADDLNDLAQQVGV